MFTTITTEWNDDFRHGGDCGSGTPYRWDGSHSRTAETIGGKRSPAECIPFDRFAITNLFLLTFPGNEMVRSYLHSSSLAFLKTQPLRHRSFCDYDPPTLTVQGIKCCVDLSSSPLWPTLPSLMAQLYTKGRYPRTPIGCCVSAPSHPQLAR